MPQKQKQVIVQGRDADDGVFRNMPLNLHYAPTKGTVPHVQQTQTTGRAALAAGNRASVVYDAAKCSGPLRKEGFGQRKMVITSFPERMEASGHTQRPRRDVTGFYNNKICKQRNAFDEDQAAAAHAQRLEKQMFGGQ